MKAGISNRGELIQGAATVGVWAWAKYGDKIVERLSTAVGTRVHAKAIQRWNRVSWKRASDEYREKVQLLYGSTRVLGKPNPLPLDDIYTEVYILDKPTAYRRYSIEDLQKDPSQTKPTSHRRTSGLDLVKSQSKKRLFILGKPGAGKTTFLKYISVQCARQNIDRIPIFIGLKDWSDSGMDLMSFLTKQFEICCFPNALPFVEYVLDSGHALVLFDGLDEVKQEDAKRDKTIDDIRNFTNKYLQTQCLVSCRIAATDYTFDLFDYVEIADFTQDQIFAFATRWFAEDSQKLTAFRQGIVDPENSGLYEIANIPILLTLLCLSFSTTGQFPRRRVQVYEEGINALLRLWDATKKVERDVYYGLTIPQKRSLLARIGFNTFMENKLFFKQQELSQHITRFLNNLPGYEGKAIDGDEVLKSIEEHHGILTERAQFIYSFSHSTFQEYFAAKEVVDDSTSIALLGLLEPKTIAADRWREVILMTASLLENPTTFFERFDLAIAELIKTAPNIVEMMTWADRKARQSFATHEIVTGRLYYLSLGIIFDIDRAHGRERARLVQVALTRAQEFVKLLDRELDIFENKLTAFPVGLNKKRADNVALELDRAYDLPQELSVAADGVSGSKNLSMDLELTRLQFVTDLITYSVSESPRRAFAFKFADYCHGVRQRSELPPDNDIESALVEITTPHAGLASQSKWVRFADLLRRDLQRNRDVGYDWRLSKEHVETLSQILQAARLIYECLGVAFVHDRAEIADRLLAAPAEI